MNNLQLELTKLIGKKKLTFADVHGIITPATLSDFHRWINDKGFLFRQAPKEIEVVMWIQGSFERIGTHIKYDSSKELLDQSEETLQQIINIITNNS